MRKPFVAALLSSLVMGCPASPKQDAPAAASETPAPTVSVAALPEPSAPASAASVGPVEEPTLAILLAGAPTEGTRRSETIFGAGGVYAGLAPDWSTQDVYNAYLIASTKKDKAMVYLETGKGLEDKALDSFAISAAYPIYLKGLAWDGPWEEAKIGPHGYEARVRRGHGMSVVAKDTRRVAIGVAVEIPNRKTIRILGSWNDPSPEVEQEFLDLVRGLGRCVHKPKRGCVPVQPLGDEDELESVPKSAPGSNPFG